MATVRFAVAWVEFWRGLTGESARIPSLSGSVRAVSRRIQSKIAARPFSSSLLKGGILGAEGVCRFLAGCARLSGGCSGATDSCPGFAVAGIRGLQIHCESPQSGMAFHARALGREHRALHLSHRCRSFSRARLRSSMPLRLSRSGCRFAGLVGSDGILPAAEFLGAVHQQLGGCGAVAAAHTVLVGQRRSDVALHRMGRRGALAGFAADASPQPMAADHFHHPVGVLSVDRERRSGLHVLSVGLAAARSRISRDFSAAVDRASGCSAGCCSV